MTAKSPIRFARAVRQTLPWLVPEPLITDPTAAEGEDRYLLRHANRLHESLSRLPGAPSPEARCLIVGSWGLEVPYLRGRLGWRNITCICAPADQEGRKRRRTRAHPNAHEEYEFTLMEHDIESGPVPLRAESFDLVVYWGCLDHLRHDPEFSLYELNRVCRSGAMLSLVTENPVSLQATHGVLRGEPMPLRLTWPESEGRWRLYAPGEVGELLAGTGWRVDLLTSIVSDPPVYWKWWKRWLFRRLVADLRRGFGLADPHWNAYILAHAVKVRGPTRSFPGWLYKDSKSRRLKLEMLDQLDAPPAARHGRARQMA